MPPSYVALKAVLGLSTQFLEGSFGFVSPNLVPASARHQPYLCTAPNVISALSEYGLGPPQLSDSSVQRILYLGSTDKNADDDAVEQVQSVVSGDASIFRRMFEL